MTGAPLVADPGAKRQGGSDRSVVEVAVGVLIRPDGQFLLASRPEGKPYAGYWEFPGGKLEPGETSFEALVRELQEELGITVDQAWPWLCREFSYPHATVRLRFFRVRSWHGEIAPIEHSAFAWLKVGEPASCLLYTSPSPRDRTRSRMPSSA